MQQEQKQEQTKVGQAKVGEFYLNPTHKVEHWLQYWRGGNVDRYYPQFKRADGWHNYQDTVSPNPTRNTILWFATEGGVRAWFKSREMRVEQVRQKRRGQHVRTRQASRQ